jgi:glucosyl-dolichyl phosphate glucuronosyltransferase
MSTSPSQHAIDGAHDRIPPASLDATVLICTFNRAYRLAETLDTLAATSAESLRWNVIVVDNNSNDVTRDVVRSRIHRYPVELRYLFESRQGKSHALNAGLAETDATIVLFTDDDVRISEGWLAAACRPMLDDPTIDYTGGPVRPIWEQPCPRWLDRTRSDLWGTLAILDYGQEPFVFEDRRRVPLGANMAVRRTLIDRIGGFDPGLGRRGRSLLGQEQAEFFCRSREAGARGLYVPAMLLHHHVPATRLTRGYFRRWWYWKGVSRSRLDQRHPVTELGVDLSRVMRLGGVPRFMVGSAARDAAGWVAALISWDTVSRMRHETMLCYFAGYVRGISLLYLCRHWIFEQERQKGADLTHGAGLNPRRQRHQPSRRSLSGLTTSEPQTASTQRLEEPKFTAR